MEARTNRISHHAHGSPLGEEEVKLTKKNLGWPENKNFYIPDEVADHFNKMKSRFRNEKKSGINFLKNIRENIP